MGTVELVAVLRAKGEVHYQNKFNESKGENSHELIVVQKKALSRIGLVVQP